MIVLAIVTICSSQIVCTATLGRIFIRPVVGCRCNRCRLGFFLVGTRSLRCFKRVLSSRLLQFMTLLPSSTFVLVVSFLAAAVTLHLRLVLGLSLLWAFLLALGTWLALSGVELHLFQPVIVVSPFWNVPLGPAVGLRVPTVKVTAPFFHLSFVQTFVNLHGNVVHILSRRWAMFPACNLILHRVFQTTIEVRGDSLVIPVGLNHLGQKLGFVFRCRSTLLDGLESPFGFHLFIPISKRALKLIEQRGLAGHNHLGRVLQLFEIRVLQVVFQMREDPLVRGSSEIRRDEQELFSVRIQFVRIQTQIRQALKFERLDLVSLSREFSRSVHFERSSGLAGRCTSS